MKNRRWTIQRVCWAVVFSVGSAVAMTQFHGAMDRWDAALASAAVLFLSGLWDTVLGR